MKSVVTVEPKEYVNMNYDKIFYEKDTGSSVTVFAQI